MLGIKEILAYEFEAEVLKSSLPVLVEFWAPWCGPCLSMAPVLEEVAKDLEGKAVIVKINVEEDGNRELAEKYQVQSVPFMKIFKNGSEVKELTGVQTKDNLVSLMKAQA